MPQQPRPSQTLISKKMVAPAMETPLSAASPNSLSSKLPSTATTQTAATNYKTSRQKSTLFRVGAHKLLGGTTTDPPTTTGGATAQTRAHTHQLFHRQHHSRTLNRFRVPAHPQTDKAISTRIQQIHPRKGSIRTASCTQPIRIHKSATAPCVPFTLGRPSATLVAAVRTLRGETAGGDAVNRRRPPCNKQQRFVICSRFA